ncbi:carbohydrate esterase family 16 [Pyrrhoderma noxium]|uniref:Carbohydrate esterase family 16 n=1 Tax=Pyrrhoderma noxium TaxID=2282107 RepID=A0A286UU76_9AGAM|nr:carbohydrate esterase family 16 [Pyrrhoderma noxium]
MNSFSLLLATGVFASIASASPQQIILGQCRGTEWAGAETCVSRAVCAELIDYYSKYLSSSKSSSTPASITTSEAVAPPPVLPVDASFWFSFGDSYTQTGFDPAGVLPTDGNPLGNPTYPGHTAVGGTNWIDVDTVTFNNSLILTYNYAYGGATIDASLVPSMVLSMTDQVNQFLTGAANRPSTTPWTSENSLFSFWIGINDLGNSYSKGGDRDAFSDTLLDAYFALVQKIVSTGWVVLICAVGGRNFLFINVPPTDRSPWLLAQSKDAQSLLKTVIAGYNLKLADRASQLEANNTGVKTWVWDSNSAFSLILDNPTAFGFTDATSYGGIKDFWGNNYHPSSAAHTIFGKNISTTLTGTRW